MRGSETSVLAGAAPRMTAHPLFRRRAGPVVIGGASFGANPRPVVRTTFPREGERVSGGGEVSEILSRFRAISMLCEAENFPSFPRVQFVNRGRHAGAVSEIPSRF